MAKTKLTKLIEAALEEECREKRIYGCEEVTIGFARQKMAREIVDYMIIDNKEQIRCYEIKVTLSDLHSKAKLSFYGHLNYLVVSEELYQKKDKWNINLPYGTGIIIANPSKKYKRSVNYKGGIEEYEGVKLTVAVKAKTVEIGSEMENILKESLIRTLFWKMIKYKDASDSDKYLVMKNDLERNTKSIKKLSKELDMFKNKHYGLIRYLVRYKGFSEDDLITYL